MRRRPDRARRQAQLETLGLWLLQIAAAILVVAICSGNLPA